MSTDALANDSAEMAPADLVQVGVYPNYAIGSEHGLVVLAMGHPYWLMPAADGFALFVEAAADEAVREQLARFDRESRRWPPPPDEPRSARALDFRGSLLWALLAVAAYFAQSRWPGFPARGALDADAVFVRGEIWRPFTALWLHADEGHLIANLVSGLFVFAALSSTFGRLAGAWRLVVAAMLGNLAAAAAQFPEPYTSVGASTAIFAGLGLMTGRACRHAVSSPSRRWQPVFVPIAAGFCVLALYGAGGVRVDIGAHLCGFAAGAALGIAAPGITAPAIRAPSAESR